MNNKIQYIANSSETECRRFIGLLLIAIAMVGLVYSRVAVSVGLIGLILNTLLGLDFRKKFPLIIRTGLSQVFTHFFKTPALWLFSLIFIWVFFTGIYSEDTHYWLERVRLKLPLLSIPVVAAGFPKINKHTFLGILALWVVLISMTLLGVGVNYFLHYDEIIAGLKQGHAVPVPTNHVRFSLMVAFSAVTALWMYRQKFVLRYSFNPTPALPFNASLMEGGLDEKKITSIKKFHKKNTWLWLGLFGWNFIAMHFLAVRSGLAVMYIMLFTLVIIQLFKRSNIKVGIVALAVLCLLPFVAYQTVPSIKARVGYALWDWQQYQKGESEFYADSERMRSLHVGWHIANNHKLLGVGSGDLRSKVKQTYAELYPKTRNPVMPHNQYLSVWAGMGLLGLTIFLVAWFAPVFYKKAWKKELWLLFYIMISISFMVENTVESSVGIGLVSVFWLVLYLGFIKKSNAPYGD